MSNLFVEAQVAAIEARITTNRIEASQCRDDPQRNNALNNEWFELEMEKHRLTGADPAPYRMGK